MWLLPICRTFAATHCHHNFAHFCLFLFLKTLHWCANFMTTLIYESHTRCRTQESSAWTKGQGKAVKTTTAALRTKKKKWHCSLLGFIFLWFPTKYLWASTHWCPSGSLLALLDQSVFERQEYTLDQSLTDIYIRVLKMLNETRKLAKSLGEHSPLNAQT